MTTAAVPITAAVGRRIKCPECGKPARVSRAKRRVAPGVPAAPVDPDWCRVDCTGRCIAKLYPRETVVHLEP